MRRIPLAKPDITALESRYVQDVLQSGVLSIGPRLEEFERRIQAYVGVKHAVAVNSGTSALHLAVRALGIGEGDEVITTPFSFIASANCALFERARPVFVDIEHDTLNIDMAKIEAAITPRTKAVLAVDVFGQPVDAARLRRLADAHGLRVIEDSAEALGSAYRGVMAGADADAAVFAFYPNKQITTGEGGVVVTNDDETAWLCRSMRSQGRPITGQWLEHERLGYNYRLSELHAALGVAQMERIDELLAKRTRAAALYHERLAVLPWVSRPVIAPDVSYMSWFVYVIRVDAAVRDGLVAHLLARGVDCKAYFPPIHSKTFYKEAFGYAPGDFPVAEAAGASCLAIPFYGELTADDVDYVAAAMECF